MTNKELLLKHGAIKTTRLVNMDCDTYILSEKMIDAYSAELLANASSEPVGYVNKNLLDFWAKNPISDTIHGRLYYGLIGDVDTPLFKANPINTEMVETIKRLEEALNRCTSMALSNNDGITDSIVKEALASISPAIKQQYTKE